MCNRLKHLFIVIFLEKFIFYEKFTSNKILNDFELKQKISISIKFSKGVQKIYYHFC